MKAKKMWFVVIMFLMLGSLTAIDRTFTIDDATLQGIRDACDVSIQTDPLIYTYWDEYTRTTRDYTPEELEMLGDRAFTDRFYLETNAVNAYTHIILNSVSSLDELQDIRDYIHTFDWHDYKLAIHNPPPYENYNTTHPEWEAGWDSMSSYQRGRELAFDILFISYIIDMIYYAYDPDDPNEPAAHNAIMEDIITDYNDFIHWVYDSFFDYNNWANLGWESYGGGVVPIGFCEEWQDNDGYKMPGIGTQSTNRMTDVCGIGYGCIVTQEYFPENINENNPESLINFVRNEFVSDFPLPAETNYYGLQDYYVTKSGMYTSGLTYQNRVLYLTPLFFSALNRKHDINLYDMNNSWNCNIVPSMIKQTLRRIDPEMHHINQEDDYRVYGIISSSGNYIEFRDQSKQIERGLLCFYYQNSDDMESRKDTRWYVHRLKEKCSGDAYPREWYEHDLRSFPVVMSFNPGTVSSLPISNEGGHIPNYLSEGNYSDGELTILRPEITENNALTDKSWLVVNHENSFTNCHRNDDKTSFQLYYKSKPFIIEAGYAPTYTWVDWFKSSYAQNLLIVNPDLPDSYTYTTTSGSWEYLKEEEYLALPFDTIFSEYRIIAKDPTSKMTMGYMGEDDEFFNPAKKEYLIENENINHLKVNVNYNNNISQHNTEENHPCVVIRNYYSFNDEYYVIFDEIENSDGYSNIYRNQIHLNDDDQIDDEIILLSGLDSAFKQKIDNLYLFGCMGATPNFQEELEYRSLPLGWTWWDYDLGKSHSRFSITTNATSNPTESFLTLLIPSEIDTNPINDISPGAGQYAAKYSLNTGYNCYAAVSDGNDVYCDGGNTRFVTDAYFLLIEANNIFTVIKKLILNSDNFLEVRDMGGTDFTNVVVFDSDYDSEEVIAEWTENDELEITTLMSFTSPIPLPIPNPKYKILRCGVLPEDLISKTHYYSSGDTTPQERGTIGNNIGNLAYDDNYFYVNYSYSNLASDNLLTSELTIHQGIFDGITIQGVTQFGTGDIVLKNEIPVPFGTEIVFLPGSNPLMAKDTKFVVSGQVTAIGDSLNIIEFDKISSYNWEGFYIDSDGAVDFQYCKFSSAKNAIQCFGDIDLTNSEITNCDYGLQINSPTSYKVNDTAIFYGKYGVIISNTSSPFAASHFENNFIYDCQYGLFLYNTNAEINNNAIYNNDDKGVYISRRSHPVILSNYIGNTRNGVIDNPEIYLIGDSYPVLDYKYNDIVVESGGSSKSIYNASGADNQYYCRSNFWGDGITTIEIIQSFYPPEWEVIFQPICDSTNTGFTPPFGVGDRLFDEGLEAEMNGNLVLAKQKYLLSIEENPDDVESLWSASRLLNCVDPDIGFGYNEVQQLYEDIMTDSLNTDLYELSKQSAINCDRKMENFQEAIYQYEIMFEDSLSIIDSVFTQLDIVYTYMEAEAAGGRASGIRFISDNHAVRNSKHAKEMENDLLALLMQETNDGGVYSPIVVKVKLHGNFPNPFNPTTMISFSIPDESKIKLTIYNIKGQKVKTLVNDNLAKGIHEILWNGRNDNNRSVASGVYFYKLSVNGKNHFVKKCLMLK